METDGICHGLFFAAGILCQDPHGKQYGRGMALDFPCANTGKAVNKQHGTGFGTVTQAHGSSCPLYIPRWSRALWDSLNRIDLGLVSPNLHWAPLLSQSKRPPKLLLCSFYLCQWDSNNPRGEITLPTSAIISLACLLEEHRPVENEPKDELTPSPSPTPRNKLLGRGKWECRALSNLL